MNKANKVKLINTHDVFDVEYKFSEDRTSIKMNYNQLKFLLKSQLTYWEHLDNTNKIENGFSIYLKGVVDKIEKIPDSLPDDIEDNSNFITQLKRTTEQTGLVKNSYSSDQILITLDIVNKNVNYIKELKNSYCKFYEKDNNKVFFYLLEIFNNHSYLYRHLNGNNEQIESALEYISIKVKLNKQKNIEASDELDIIQKQIQTTNTLIEEQRKDLESFNQEYKDELDAWKKTKAEWFNKWDTDKSEWYTSKMEEVSNLELIYEEKLKLSKPVDYWKEEAKKRKKSFFIWSGVTAFLSVAVILVSSQLIKEFYDIAIRDSISKSFIPYSFIMVALVTFIIYLLRMAIKIMMSAKHLQTEYEQKATFTYFYLTLLKENEVSTRLEKEDRSFIIQTLFSQVDTGLIKSDSGNDVEKLLMGLLSKKS